MTREVHFWLRLLDDANSIQRDERPLQINVDLAVAVPPFQELYLFSTQWAIAFQRIFDYACQRGITRCSCSKGGDRMLSGLPERVPLAHWGNLTRQTRVQYQIQESEGVYP